MNADNNNAVTYFSVFRATLGEDEEARAGRFPVVKDELLLDKKCANLW
jgi:hypothetical protein